MTEVLIPPNINPPNNIIPPKTDHIISKDQILGKKNDESKKIPLNYAKVYTTFGNIDIWSIGSKPSNYPVGTGTCFFVNLEDFKLQNKEYYKKINGIMFVTNHHVISGYNRFPDTNQPHIYIEMFSKRFYVKILSQYPERDLALLTISDADIKKFLNELNNQNINIEEFGFKLYEGPITTGMKIVSVGYPLDEENTFTDGYTAGPSNFMQMDFIKVTTSVSPGNSGGPVLLFYKGKYYVIGINVLQRLRLNNVYHAIPVIDLYNYIKLLFSNNNVNVPNIVRLPPIGFNYQKLQTNYKSYYDIKKNTEGVVVTKSNKGNLFNVNVGDIITGIGVKNKIYNIDNLGFVHIPKSNEKVKFMDYFTRVDPMNKVTMRVFNNKTGLEEERTIEYIMKKDKIPIYVLPDETNKIGYWKSEKTGITLMNLSMNHVQKIVTNMMDKTLIFLLVYKVSREKNKGLVIVSNIVPMVDYDYSDYFSTGSILKYVGYKEKLTRIKKEVTDIESFKKIIDELIKQKNEYVVFEFSDGKEYVFNTSELSESELKYIS
jgi:hypothetical protein